KPATTPTASGTSAASHEITENHSCEESATTTSTTAASATSAEQPEQEEESQDEKNRRNAMAVIRAGGRRPRRQLSVGKGYSLALSDLRSHRTGRGHQCCPVIAGPQFRTHGTQGTASKPVRDVRFDPASGLDIVLVIRDRK